MDQPRVCEDDVYYVVNKATNTGSTPHARDDPHLVRRGRMVRGSALHARGRHFLSWEDTSRVPVLASLCHLFFAC